MVLKYTKMDQLFLVRFANSNGATSIGAFLGDTLFGLAVNDVIELYGYQDLGGNKSLTAGSGNTFMTIRKVG